MLYLSRFASLPVLTLAATLAAGCGTAATANDAASGVDAAASTDDAAVPHDSGLRDAVVVDAFVPRDAPSGPDTDTARCSYVGVDEVIVLCGTDYTFVSHFTSELSSCPPFYGFDPEGEQFADFASAIASDTSCDASCQWHFATSVSRIYCGHRDGYESLSATGCADIYRFSEGYYDFVEEHDADNPCP